MARFALFPLLLAGCWKLEVTELAESDIAFEGIEAPQGWVVTSWDLPSDFTCPDGKVARMVAVHPGELSDPLPVAVFLHSGAFEYIEREAGVTDPLAGDAFNDLRVTRDWSLRRTFATLGMYPSGDASEEHLGALPTALTEQGIALLFPTNCWGDWWHNDRDEATNDLQVDGFQRDGARAANLVWGVASGDVKPSAYSWDLPFSSSGVTYLVGQGEGARGASELLARGATPDALLVDSPVDDLRVYWNESAFETTILPGLQRIFPDGPDTTVAASLQAVPNYPERSVFVYSSLDPLVPATSNAGILARLETLPNAWVYDAGSTSHVVTGADLDIARQAVAYLVQAE